MNSNLKLSAEAIQYFLSLARVSNSWDGEICIDYITQEEKGWLRELRRNGLVGVTYENRLDESLPPYLWIRAHPAGCEFAKALGAEWMEKR